MNVLTSSVPVLLRGFGSSCYRDTAAQSAFSSGDGFNSIEQVEAHRSTRELSSSCVGKLIAVSASLTIAVVDVACKDQDAAYFSGDHRERQGVEVKFGDIVDAFTAAVQQRDHWLRDVDGLHVYLCQCPIAVPKPDETCDAPVLPRLMELFKLPPDMPVSSLTQVNLWMSIDSSRTGIHYDAYRNVLLVLTGKKIVKLYPPSQTRYLYPRPVYSASANHSTVNFAEPDLTSHPEFIHAKPTVLTASEGDAIFIPEGWWHQVDSDPCTIAINFWFEGVRKTLVGSGDMEVYYARFVMHELVKKETIRRLAEYRDSQCTHAPSTTLSFEEQGQRQREASIVCTPACDLPVVLATLATTKPSELMATFCDASDAFAAFLADAFDQHVSEDSAWISTVFESFGDGADEVRSALLAKQEDLKRQVLKLVLEATFGC